MLRHNIMRKVVLTILKLSNSVDCSDCGLQNGDIVKLCKRILAFRRNIFLPSSEFNLGDGRSMFLLNSLIAYKTTLFHSPENHNMYF
jgi:hypothetical protein